MIVLTRSCVLVLEGAEAAGKSGHADALAESLCAFGLPAEAYHHPAPPTMLAHDPLDRALWYVRARAALECRALAFEAPRVIVADRWWESTLAYAQVAPPFAGHAMRHLVALETCAWAESLPVRTMILDAPDTELERRTLARGLAASANDLHPRRDEIRAWYRKYARSMSISLPIDTTAPRNEVAELLVWLAHQLLADARALEFAPARAGFDANGSPA